MSMGCGYHKLVDSTSAAHQGGTIPVYTVLNVNRSRVQPQTVLNIDVLWVHMHIMYVCAWAPEFD